MRRYFAYSLALNVLSIVLSHHSFASNNIIQYNAVIHEDINPAGQVDTFRFMATANNRITFRMIRRWGVDVNFLTRAEIYKPDGSLFYAATTNTLRLDTTLITGGTYTIWIMDDNGHETGGYGLNLERLKPLTGDTITYDGVTHNDITYAPEVDAYNFMATANDRITFRMIRRWGVDVNFLTRAEIYKPDGSLFYAATTNTLRLDTTLVTGGTYTIWIMDDNGHETGGYGLNLERLKPLTGDTITYDGVTHNDITYAPEIDAYNFIATANDRITFRMIRRWGVDVNFLTRAEIYKPDGSLFYAATTNTLRLDTTLVTGGTYTIWIMDDSGHETGGYGLNLERLKPLTGDTITYDGVTHNDITYAPEVDAYNFMATANDRITFRMIRRWGVDVNFLTRAEIYKPDGSLFYAATTNTLRLDTTLVTGGTYTIWIMDDNGHETGGYGLNLERLKPLTGTAVAF